MIFLYLVQHDWLYAVTQHLSELSCNHWLATTLENTKLLLLRPEITFTVCTVCLYTVHYVLATLAPIRHMSLTMCDCIISAISWEWLGVLMKVGLLLGGRSSLVPAGTCFVWLRQEMAMKEQPTASPFYKRYGKIFLWLQRDSQTYQRHWHTAGNKIHCMSQQHTVIKQSMRQTTLHVTGEELLPHFKKIQLQKELIRVISFVWLEDQHHYS